MAHIPTIGVLVGWTMYASNTISDYAFSVCQGILAAAQARGCNVLIGCGLGSTTGDKRYATAWPILTPETTFVPVGPWNTDGLLVISPVLSEERSAYLRELYDGGFPIVFAGSDAPGSAVLTDNAQGIEQAVAHLWQHGHRQIAYIAGDEHGAGDGPIRLEAFQRAMYTHGAAVDPRLIAYGRHTTWGGQAAMQALIKRDEPFTAVIISNLDSGVGAVKALHDAGYRIPEDVAIIAVDDHIQAEAQEPPLTTVHIQTFEMGYQAVGLLVDYINGERHGPVTIPLPAHLVIRRSCGCQPGMIADQPAHALTGTQVAELITDAILAKADRLDHATIIVHAQALVDSFRTSLCATDEAPFMSALAAFLHQIDARNERLFALQDAISVLRNHMDVVLDDAGQLPAFAHALIDQARLVLSDAARRRTAHRFVSQAVIADRLGTLSAQLMTTLESAQILRLLAEHLPDIGIRHVQIALLEAEDEDATAWSSLWTRAANDADITPRRLPTSAFPPADLYVADTPYQLAIVPLIAQDTQIGYIAYDAGQLASCGSITRQVAAALLSCTLYREAAEGRRLAEDASQLKTRFLSMVSHELRTPLNVIIGLSELTLRDYGDGIQPAAQDLERIASSAHHLGFLIHDVLDFASSQAGQMRLSLEPLDLIEALQPVIATGAFMAQDKGLDWQVLLPNDQPLIVGDRTRLRQIVLNMLSNAVKFTAHGTITLAIEAATEQVTLTVRDTGIGIPIEEHTTIFDEFYQSTRTAASGYGGVGLGLAISRHLVNLHGGTITAHSSGIEGEGATMIVTLPTEMAATSAAPAPLSQMQLDDTLRQLLANAASRSTILMVDDDLTIIDTYTRLLQSSLPDCHVIVAQTNQQTLEVVQQTRPDLILLDLIGPELDGFVLLEALCEHDSTRDIPVIILSGKALTEAEMVYMTNAVVAVLEKGVINVAETLTHIMAALNGSGRLGSASQRLVLGAIAYIHAQYAQSVTRDMLAQHLSVSENYLTNCFQRELGISPLTYLNRYRIKQARTLLAQNAQNVTEVAQAVGFSDVNYFGRVFQRELGMSPSAYRRGSRRGR